MNKFKLETFQFILKLLSTLFKQNLFLLRNIIKWSGKLQYFSVLSTVIRIFSPQNYEYDLFYIITNVQHPTLRVVCFFQANQNLIPTGTHNGYRIMALRIRV